MTTLNIPSSPSNGDTYTANGVVYTWDGSKWKADSSNVTNLNGGQLGGFRNKLINGDFRIWQRATTSGAEYVADRWRMAGGSGNTYVRHNNDTDLAALGFSHGLKNEGPGSTIFGQYIELDRNGRACQFPVGSQWTWTVWSTDAINNTVINWSKDDNSTSEVAVTPGSWVVIDTQGSLIATNKLLLLQTILQMVASTLCL